MAKKKEKEEKQKQKKQKPKKEHSATHTSWLINILAFLALSAAALLLLVGPIVRGLVEKTDGGVGGQVLQILNVVAMYCLLGAIAIPAWHFVRGKRRGWKVFYFIMLVVYILATVFGVTFGIL